MSWIGGEFVLNDVTKKDLDAAADRIRYAVRSNANLAEFPNMGSRINPFKHICPQIIFNGYEEAEEILERKRSEWSRNYTGYVAFRDLESTNKTKRIIELKEKIESQYHVRCLTICADVSDVDQVNIMVSEIEEKMGGVDVLINNAGISANKKIEDTTSEEFMHIMDININAMYNTSKAVTIYMKKQGYGVILNTSSMVSKYGQPSGIGYPTSKFAVNGFTLSLARELASYNIRVNAVAPGITNTDMVKRLPQEMIEPLIKSIALGRIGEPKDIANAYLFLASDMASYITGVILSVDGLARS